MNATFFVNLHKTVQANSWPSASRIQGFFTRSEQFWNKIPFLADFLIDYIFESLRAYAIWVLQMETSAIIQGVTHSRGFHYHGSHCHNFWLMYLQGGDFCVTRGPPTVPLTRISCNTFFSKSQNVRKAGILYISSHSKPCTRLLKYFVLITLCYKTKHLRSLIQAIIWGFEWLEILGFRMSCENFCTWFNWLTVKSRAVACLG